MTSKHILPMYLTENATGVPMPIVSQNTTLERVEHVLASGTGTLDFSVQGENEYYTWNGREDADWVVTGVERVENAEEDRLIFYPDGPYFRCEIAASGEEFNEGAVHCSSV